MRLLDKFKDLFTDEEEVYETKEVEEAPIEEKNKLPTFMRNKIEKEEEEKKILEEQVNDKKETTNNDNKTLAEENIVSKEEQKFPFNFDDDDFIDTTVYSRSAVQKEREAEKRKEEIQAPSQTKLYSNKKDADKSKKFRPTPVISPVYGILDKNYKKEEVVSKEEDSYAIPRGSKKVDFESVRKKAYGTLTDDIKANMLCENCEFLKEIKNKKVERLSEDDLLYNMTTDDVLEDKNTSTREKKSYDDYDKFGVTYDIPPKRDTKKYDDVKIVNHALEETKTEKIEIKEVPEDKIDTQENKNQKQVSENKNNQKDLELTDDLFNLIDSMYKERND